MAEENPDIRVIEAGEGDIDAIATFLHELWRESGPHAPGLTGATPQLIAEISAPDAIRARLGGPERRIFIAYEGSSIIGFAATRTVDADRTELAGIMVLQSRLGRGVGTPLVDAAVAAARAQGSTRMTVSTEVGNDRAIGFYEARGFSVDGSTTHTVEGTRVAVTNLSRLL